MGDGRAEGSSAIGDGGQAAISRDLTYVIGHANTHYNFESSQLEGSYVGDLLYPAILEQMCLSQVALILIQVCSQTGLVNIRK